MVALICVEAHQYLLARSLFASEILRQFVSSEIFCFGRFDIRNEFAADNGAEDENFNDPVGVYRLVVLVPVLNGDEPATVTRSPACARLWSSIAQLSHLFCSSIFSSFLKGSVRSTP